MDLEEVKRAKPIVEALLFASEGPLLLGRLKALLNVDPEVIVKAVDRLNREYWETGRAFLIVEVAGGFQMATRSQFAPWVRKLVGRSEARLSRAAFEVLAIVAYRQPVTRQEVEAIRGVNSGSVLAGLLQRSLVRIVGRSDAPGKPLLYGTTRKFLQTFGLRSLDDLPKPEEVEEMVQREEGAPQQVPSHGGGGLPQEGGPDGGGGEGAGEREGGPDGPEGGPGPG
ncbi:MAG TPA: SMC-Scp complex subunit ScpB [Candidatus Latescibacteria bacterium]|nr:SMC-Scp complex subunit ScpB [Candidatus Latescibacterota bacterium]